MTLWPARLVQGPAAATRYEVSSEAKLQKFCIIKFQNHKEYQYVSYLSVVIETALHSCIPFSYTGVTIILVMSKYPERHLGSTFLHLCVINVTLSLSSPFYTSNLHVVAKESLVPHFRGLPLGNLL